MRNFKIKERSGKRAISGCTRVSEYAEVAELVDALGSGSSEGILVGVRVPSSAPL